MNPKKLSLLLLAVSLVGCSNSSGDTATAEDKKNLDNLIQNGVGNHPAPPGGAKNAPGGVPVSGKVDPP